MSQRVRKKSRKKPLPLWKIFLGEVILYGSFVCGGATADAADGIFNDVGRNGAAAHARQDDAQRPRERGAASDDIGDAERSLARLERENRLLREEVERNRRSLDEITKQYQEQNEQNRQLRLVLSGALASGQVRGAGEREEQLLRAMNDTAESGRALALKAVEFCELVEAQTSLLPLERIRQAEIRLRADELRRASRQFVALTSGDSDGGTLEKCRVLAVDRGLSVVVLSVGTVHGAFNGLMYYVGKDKAVLRVVGVRPFVAAAQLVSGDIEEIAPGMEAVTQRTKAK